MPAPIERRTDITSNALSNTGSEDINGIAKNMISVTIAIKASEKIINFFRLYLSANTPPIKETKNCGRYEQIEKAATQAPLDVFNVTYHIIAICTSVEPNSVIHWLMRKRIVRFLQLLFVCIILCVLHVF